MKVFWRFVVLSWCLTLGSCVFAGVHAGDRDPQQWSSVLTFVAIAFGSGFLTLAFCFIVCFVQTIPRKSDNSDGEVTKPAEAGSNQNQLEPSPPDESGGKWGVG